MERSVATARLRSLKTRRHPGRSAAHRAAPPAFRPADGRQEERGGALQTRDPALIKKKGGPEGPPEFRTRSMERRLGVLGDLAQRTTGTLAASVFSHC